MEKLIGVQAEINITIHSDILKGLGKGIEKGSVHIEDVFKELKGPIIEVLKKQLLDTKEK
jgi:hypothetical protein